MRNSIGNFIFGVPLKIQRNIKLLSDNLFLDRESAPVAVAKTLLLGSVRQRACGIVSGIAFLGCRSKLKKQLQ